MARLEAVRKFRPGSKRLATRELASTPSNFAFASHDEREYIIVPSVSSERRTYIPIGFLPPEVIASNLCLIIPGATIVHFGVLSSSLHMAWVRAVCGRLKSDFRYSAGIVYNNFPWPVDATEAQRGAIEAAAQGVLDARARFPEASLADLYDPLTMPPALVKAHQALDRTVDAAYVPSGGKKSWASDAERVAFLFALYQRLTSLLPAAAPVRKARGKRASGSTSRT